MKHRSFEYKDYYCELFSVSDLFERLLLLDGNICKILCICENEGN